MSPVPRLLFPLPAPSVPLSPPPPCLLLLTTGARRRHFSALTAPVPLCHGARRLLPAVPHVSQVAFDPLAWAAAVGAATSGALRELRPPTPGRSAVNGCKDAQVLDFDPRALLLRLLPPVPSTLGHAVQLMRLAPGSTTSASASASARAGASNSPGLPPPHVPPPHRPPSPHCQAQCGRPACSDEDARIITLAAPPYDVRRA